MRSPLLAILLGAATLAPRPTVGQSAPPAASAAADVRDLPLVEVRATGTDGARTLVLLMTGDGNWASIDRELAAELAAHGVAVVGLNARAYLEQRKATPELTASDAARVLRHYLAAWDRRRIALVGYSRGADIVPFMANRLPAELKPRLALVAMLGPATSASFEFHWTDLEQDTRRTTDIPTLPELERLRGTRMLCIYGSDEEDSLCRSADATLVTRVERSGAHHFDGNFRALGDLIVDALARP